MPEIIELRGNDTIICALVRGAHGDRVLEIFIEDDPDDLDLYEIERNGAQYWVSHEEWLTVDMGSPCTRELQAFKEIPLI